MRNSISFPSPHMAKKSALTHLSLPSLEMCKKSIVARRTLPLCSASTIANARSSDWLANTAVSGVRKIGFTAKTDSSELP